MDSLPATGVRKREMASPESRPDKVEVINLDDDNAAQHKKKECKKAEGSRADQAGSFAKVVQNFHDEKMMLVQLYSKTRSEKNAEMLLKLLEDSSKSVNNIVELERIREENKVLVKEGKSVEVKKPEIPKDVERKSLAKKKPEVLNKNRREKAGSSRPALHPTAYERDRAKEEARKKTIPCPRCDGTNTKFISFNHEDLRKDKRMCYDCNRAWVVGAKSRK